MGLRNARSTPDLTRTHIFDFERATCSLVRGQPITIVCGGWWQQHQERCAVDPLHRGAMTNFTKTSACTPSTRRKASPECLLHRKPTTSRRHRNAVLLLLGYRKVSTTSVCTTYARGTNNLHMHVARTTVQWNDLSASGAVTTIVRRCSAAFVRCHKNVFQITFTYRQSEA